MKNDIKQKKIEFSKIIFWLLFALNAYIILFASAMIWRTMDLSPLAYLIPAESGVFAIATGFYFWKARAENKLKLMKAYEIELSADALDNLGGNI